MLFLLAGIAVLLTCAMFMTREMMLGFPAAMFWAILGGYAYTLSTTPWGDVYYYVFIACALGMTVFSMLAAYGLREKRDTLAEKEEEGGYIDEGGGESDIERHDKNEVVTQSSKRVKSIRKRAEARREGKRRRKRINFGPLG